MRGTPLRLCSGIPILLPFCFSESFFFLLDVLLEVEVEVEIVVHGWEVEGGI